MTSFDALLKQHQEYKIRSLSLNIDRSQPSGANLDLSLPILCAINGANYTTDGDTEIRNYPAGLFMKAEGGPSGLFV